MEKFFYETKKIIVLIVIIVLTTIVIAPISKAAYTDSIELEGVYKFKGVAMLTYTTEDAARNNKILRSKISLTKGDKLVVKYKSGNILGIIEEGEQNIRYIKLNILNTARNFVKISEDKETTVQNKIKVTEIELIENGKVIYLNNGNTYKIEAKITPQNATEKLIWVSNNTDVAIVDQKGLVTVKKAGEVQITVKSEDGGVRKVCTIKATKIELKEQNNVVNDITVGIKSEKTLEVRSSLNNSKRTVNWTSDNSNIATVDNGKVKGVAEGTTTIRARTAEGVEVTCKVTVKKIAVTGVTLNKSSLTLGKNKSSTLTAIITPTNATNKDVTWSSSNTNVATVDSNGKVTGKKLGTATITVKTNDGGKTATCTVTVIQAVTGVTLNKTNLTMYIGETTTLNSTITPSDAENKNVTWTSSKTEVATVNSNGKVTAKAEGTTTITVKTNDGGKTATCTVTVDPYKYKFGNNVYTIAVKKNKLDSVLSTIHSKNIAQRYGGSGYCNRISTCHIYMLLGKVSESSVKHRSYNDNTYYGSYSSTFNVAGTEKYASYSNIKSYLDAKKPLRLHVDSDLRYEYSSAHGGDKYTQAHWVTVVGYKGECNKLSDLLILSCYEGYLIKGGTGDAAAIWTDYDFRIYN